MSLRKKRGPRKQHFSASVKLAIAYMNKHVAQSETVDPKPQWKNFVWFDDIKPGEIEHLQDFESVDKRLVRRKVYFYIEDTCVGYVYLQGICYTVGGFRATEWAVDSVMYSLAWPEKIGVKFTPAEGHVPDLLKRHGVYDLITQ